ncbi:MAG TPA: isocitrate lyase/PEP mutase family protein [Gammaproteobacteria bacterium]|nr:isocitrate lyase/PEP mutase family protein [Gammaproteobacteria bacterium]
MPTKTKSTRRLRELVHGPRIIRMLGAHDMLGAVLIEQAGFESVFIGGFGTSASMLGLPDINFMGLKEMVKATRRMAQRVSVPVLADADTGHGDLHIVQRCVAEFELAGAAGVILEDQVQPKRCGHFAGKQVILPRRCCSSGKLRLPRAQTRTSCSSPAPMRARPTA